MNGMKKAPTSRAKRSEPVMTVHVQVACRTRGIPDARRIRRWARAALADRRNRTEVTIRIVGAREGRGLNERWRGLPHATNVLSFPAPVLALTPGALGDIAVCAPVVAKEAKAQGKAPAAHWAHLVIHGVLHLLGHDHENRHDATVMEALEIRILAGLGFPDPYSVEKT
jgi:probable rRNA maturation factor